MLALLRAAAGPVAENRGASQTDIDALPTRIYHAPAQAPVVAGALPEAEKERVTCMVSSTEHDCMPA
jgi:hypothetical protein